MQRLTLKPQNGSLLDLALKEMNRRNAVHAERYLPYNIASIILHVMNLRNQQAPFYYDESGPYNFRLHLLYLSPTGGGKTYWVKNLGRQSNALFKGTQVPISYKGGMTAAAFTGTARFGANGEPKITKGIVQNCAKHVVMIEEFSSVLKSMDNPYGGDLENHFLTALDSGWIFRDLAPASIAFQTHVTVQAASQFTRVSTSSGMLRRFIVTMFRPTREDRIRLKNARRARRHLKYEEKPAIHIRKYFNKMNEDLINIDKLEIDEETLNEFFDLLGETNFLPHYDEDIYERLIIGMNISMMRDIPSVPYITLTEGMKRYVINAVKWRHDALVGPELSLALVFIKDWLEAPPAPYTLGEGLPATIYRTNMINFGLSFEESSAILQKLKRYNVVRVSNNKIRLGSL